MPTPEPSIDEIMQEVTDAIKNACAYQIDAAAFDEFLSVYKPKFNNHLNNGFSWNKERLLVLAAATQHGLLAESFAKLAHQRTVTQVMLTDAGDLVRKYCNIGLIGRGLVGGWCA